MECGSVRLRRRQESLGEEEKWVKRSCAACWCTRSLRNFWHALFGSSVAWSMARVVRMSSTSLERFKGAWLGLMCTSNSCCVKSREPRNADCAKRAGESRPRPPCFSGRVA